MEKEKNALLQELAVHRAQAHEGSAVEHTQMLAGTHARVAELEGEVERLGQQVVEYEHKLVQTQKDSTQAHDKSGAAQTQADAALERLEHELADTQDRLSEAQTHGVEAQARVTEMQGKFDALQRQLELQVAETQAHQGGVVGQTQMLHDAHSHVTELEGQLERLGQEISEYEDKLSQAQTQIMEVHDKSSAAQTQGKAALERLEHELADTQDKLAEAQTHGVGAQVQMTEIQDKLDAAQTQLEKQVAEAQAYESGADEQTQMIAGTNARVAELEGQVERLERDIAVGQDKLAQAQKEVTQTHDRSDAVQTQADAAVERLEHELADTQDKLAGAQTHILETQGKLDAALTQAQAHEGSAVEQAQMLAGTHARVAELEGQVERLEREVAEGEEKLVQAQKDITKAHDKSGAAQLQADAALERLEHELADTKEKLGEAQTRGVDTQAQVTEIQGKFDGALAEARWLQDTSAKSDEALECLECALALARAELETAKGELQQTQCELQGMVTMAEAKADVVEDVVKQHTEELSESRAKHAAVEQQQQQTAGKLQQLRRDFALGVVGMREQLEAVTSECDLAFAALHMLRQHAAEHDGAAQLLRQHANAAKQEGAAQLLLQEQVCVRMLPLCRLEATSPRDCFEAASRCH